MRFVVDFEFDVLVFHQGEQSLLRDDPAHVRLPAHFGANLVHLVDEDHPAANRVQQHFFRRVGTEDSLRIRVKAAQDRAAVTLAFFGQNVRVDADEVRVFEEIGTAAQKLLDGAHERRLAGAGVADQQNIRRGMADEMLDDGHGDLSDRVVLSDNAFA